MSHDLSHWREHFPILATRTYLASHSLGAVPRATRSSLELYYDHWAQDGILAWEGPYWQAIGDFCRAIEAIIGAAPQSVVPLPNVTRAMAAVASCFDFEGDRNRIVLTDLEFTTSYPFWRGCERLGAQLVVVPSGDGVSVPVERVAAAIDERTLLLPLSHAYFRSGALQDLKAIAELAHDAGALVLGDGYQIVGCVPVDVTALDVDFYVGGSHKWLCGGPGAGFLYVKPALVDRLSPRLTGWFGLAEPFGYAQDTSGQGRSATVDKFLDGTVAIPALFAAQPGIDIIRQVGVEAIRAVSLQLTEHVVEAALERGYTVFSPRQAARRNGMVCLQFDGAQQAVAALIAAGVVVDWRPDCGLRVSPHFYNVDADIDRLFSILDARGK